MNFQSLLEGAVARKIKHDCERDDSDEEFLRLYRIYEPYLFQSPDICDGARERLRELCLIVETSGRHEARNVIFYAEPIARDLVGLGVNDRQVTDALIRAGMVAGLSRASAVGAVLASYRRHGRSRP